ncbi:hypothetical protein CLAFUW4_13300 [Fulvia fulva]|uniref:F-box domain-containing protein n=1 Tax=Passalora fulva TaxID=5499 RepID=A0A9Q8PJN8_PASFU|nr:uncharacterized protein CLAFUR5_13155 [Fulvia fulva]KAK4611851.1 hypothetical protein CLAFUR4_13305 [Fulvia fulva]KAK4613111.1 hypothetical protein CLAFUR0_13310 [Fulvia fulva]UJO23614.1 hypothetical protein CLAFUR5_13155 [Fulvia fulva]WPV21329.1 hypothetical protein CLAFUW4_13300 [Fulvia fulva]WPV36466.1 hypothetical protein CLAFUW7_13307 [Fulvia fulva]
MTRKYGPSGASRVTDARYTSYKTSKSEESPENALRRSVKIVQHLSLAILRPLPSSGKINRGSGAIGTPSAKPKHGSMQRHMDKENYGGYTLLQAYLHGVPLSYSGYYTNDEHHFKQDYPPTTSKPPEAPKEGVVGRLGLLRQDLNRSIRSTPQVALPQHHVVPLVMDVRLEELQGAHLPGTEDAFQQDADLVSEKATGSLPTTTLDLDAKAGQASQQDDVEHTDSTLECDEEMAEARVPDEQATAAQSYLQRMVGRGDDREVSDTHPGGGQRHDPCSIPSIINDRPMLRSNSLVQDDTDKTEDASAKALSEASTIVDNAESDTEEGLGGLDGSSDVLNDRYSARLDAPPSKLDTNAAGTTRRGGLLSPRPTPSPEPYRPDAESDMDEGLTTSSAYTSTTSTPSPLEHVEDTGPVKDLRFAASGQAETKYSPEPSSSGAMTWPQDCNALEPESQRPAPFSNLPNETTLRVMFYVGLTELLKLRLVCSHFGALIDEKSNLSLLMKWPQVIAGLDFAKLIGITRYNIRDIDYLDTLADIVTRRGLWLTKDPYILSVYIIMDIFVRQGHTASDPPPRNVWNDLWRVGYNLWQIHIQHHGPPNLRCQAWVYCWGLLDFLSRLETLPLKPYGITKEKIVEWYKKLTETPGGYLQGPRPVAVGPLNRHDPLKMPDYPLTGLYAFNNKLTGLPRAYELEIHYSPPIVPNAANRLSNLFDIPELPTQFEAYGRLYKNGYTFAWCVHRKPVLDKIKGIFTGEPRYDRQALRSNEKAIVIEDLFLY